MNKLTNLLVQLDSPSVRDVLKNLARNRSPYLAAFLDIKLQISRVRSFLLLSSLRIGSLCLRQTLTHAEENLSFVTTLSPWISRINQSNHLDEILSLLPSLVHTLFLIWQHS